MDWREYEEAVAMLYEQAKGIGTVTRNARVTDSITGQLRQIDVLVTLTERGHSLSIVIDAKFRASKISVREIESVQSLAAAVNASKAVVVAANGWTGPAERRAAASGVDLTLLTLDEALDLLVPDKWSLCPTCLRDCVVLDHHGALDMEGSLLWWLAGRCRSCGSGFAWCQECGAYLNIAAASTVRCSCGHRWSITGSGMELQPAGISSSVAI